MSELLYIATRKSPLALWQARTTQTLLSEKGLKAELLTIVTTGDKLQHTQLSSIYLNENNPHHLTTGKGLFIKEVQEALIQNKAHIAVHSMKDLPVEQTPGLVIGALLPRATPNDVLILSPNVLNEIKLDKESLSELSFETLKKLLLKSIIFKSQPIGTTSSRRQMLMKNIFSKNLNLEILRGNVDSRLKKVQNNEYAAILLAQAGLERLNLFDKNRMIPLPADQFIPATAQGVIAIEYNDNNELVVNAIKQINCSQTCFQAAIERMVLHSLEGDCNSSIGVHYTNKKITLIYGKGDFETSLIIQLTEDDLKEIENLWNKSNEIYSHFFSKILKSQFADRINKILTQQVLCLQAQ